MKTTNNKNILLFNNTVIFFLNKNFNEENLN